MPRIPVSTKCRLDTKYNCRLQSGYKMQSENEEFLRLEYKNMSSYSVPSVTQLLFSSSTDAIAMQHDLDYNVCKDDRKFKNEADRKMTDHLMQFHVGIDNGDIAINAINTKRNLVLVFRKTEKAIELATTIS